MEGAFQGRLKAGSTCSKNTGAEGAATVNRAPNTKGKGAKREMNTVKFWLEPALGHLYVKSYTCNKQLIFQRFSFIQYSFDHQIVAQMHCKWFESQWLFIKIINIKYSNQIHSFATTKT
jgi:hypothetical protein